MRPADVHASVPDALPTELPLRIEQKGANAGPLLALLVLLPAAGALLTPFLALIQAWMTEPHVRSVLAAHPVSAIQLGLAFAFWTLLFAWPIRRIAGQIARTRSIEIARGTVTVADRSLLSTRQWSEPLTAYGGIEHRIRSSLSGVRHELILAHPTHPARNILLAMAPHLSEASIAAVRGTLSTPSSPSRDLYLRLLDAYGVGNTEEIRPGQRVAA